MAIYSTAGAALATIGTVAQGTASVFQKKAFPSPITLAPGNYFMAFTCDNVLATFARSSYGAAFTQLAGVRQLAAFFALTASATSWIGNTNTFTPAFGIYEASWL